MASITSNTSIPIVDLQTVGLGHSEEPTRETWLQIGKQLSQAFSDIGFVYITRHGISDDLVKAVNDSADEFFAQSQAVKIRYNRGIDEIQGYTSINREKLAQEDVPPELRESYDVHRKTGAFPDELVPSFRPQVCSLMEALHQLTKRLLTALEHGLGLEANYLRTRHSDIFDENNGTTLRILHYPSVPADAPAATIRCGEHTDYGTITILLQDNMGGLEVLNKSEQWVPATPITGALLINVGDLLQMWTSNLFIATKHRVLVPESEQKQRCVRRSMAFFVHPNNDVIITPLDGSEPLEPPVSAKQHLDMRFTQTYQY